MIKFNKPVNLNGQELLDELNQAGIQITEAPYLDADGNLWLEIDLKDFEKSKRIVDNHNGNIIPKEPTTEEKLASVGLNLEDLKVALGL